MCLLISLAGLHHFTVVSLALSPVEESVSSCWAPALNILSAIASTNCVQSWIQPCNIADGTGGRFGMIVCCADAEHTA
jgi:hypothetical protein